MNSFVTIYIVNDLHNNLALVTKISEMQAFILLSLLLEYLHNSELGALLTLYVISSLVALLRSPAAVRKSARAETER